MTLQKLLVPVSQPEVVRPRLSVAAAIARAFRAHIDVLHVRADPQEAVPLLGEGVSGAMIEDLMAMTEREGRHRAEAVRAAFDAARAALDLPLVDRARPAPAGAGGAGAERPSIAWTERVGREDDEVVRDGHLSDLIVFGRPQGEGSAAAPSTLNAALFESGRPVLVIPPPPAGFEAGGLPVHEVGRHIALAWNASAEATRALAAAMPFLVRADLVVVLCVGEEAGPATPVVDYLALHGVSARAGTVPSGTQSVGAVLLDAAVAGGADLLVMGAYTHGRLYEMIIGGATRHVLDHAAVPLLMVH